MRADLLAIGAAAVGLVRANLLRKMPAVYRPVACILFVDTVVLLLDLFYFAPIGAMQVIGFDLPRTFNQTHSLKSYRYG